jgi:pimeloyl-ACP methyl ester carboxylesterase
MSLDRQSSPAFFARDGVGGVFTPPKVWGDETYSKLFYWNEVPKGGHFAALEQPELFVAELRNSFAQIR